MNRKRLSAPTFLLCALLVATHFSRSVRAETGDEPSQAAIQRAHEFLKTRATAEYVISFVHMGSPYDSHSLLDTGGVRRVTANGKQIPGEFALVYEFSWHGTGQTTIAFLCDKRGSVEQIQVLASNAVLSPPFDIAKVSITLLGQALLEAFKDQMKPADRVQLQAIVRSADPKAMLELGLRLRQTFR